MLIPEGKIEECILATLRSSKRDLKEQFQQSSKIKYLVCDNLLPLEIATNLHRTFPDLEILHRKRSVRESKYVGSNLDDFHINIKAALHAFQSQEVIAELSQILNEPDLLPDPSFYASGVSVMKFGDFLKPHIDNAMNADMTLYRKFNLLYYVNPKLTDQDGGELALWENGLNNLPTKISPAFNRLIIFKVNKKSWHSVEPLRTNNSRQCISNYYFSHQPEENGFHVTTFRGKTKNSLDDIVLRIDGFLRNGIRKFFKRGFLNKKHIYKKKK